MAWITLPNVSLGVGLTVAVGLFVGNKLFNLARSAFVAHEAMWRTAIMEIVGSSLQVYSSSHCGDGWKTGTWSSYS